MTPHSCLAFSLLLSATSCFPQQYQDDQVDSFYTDTVRCSRLYERCQFWDCCGELECMLAKRSGMNSFVFFCSDPSVNETANTEGLNNYLFWHPDAYPVEENMITDFF